MDAWRGFTDGEWKNEINVSDFIQKNYTGYEGDASFLEGPTSRTERVLDRLNKLLIKENEKGGVLDVDTEHVYSKEMNLSEKHQIDFDSI